MRNAIYEQELTRQGVTFTYMERVDLTAIDAKKGLANQARLAQPIIEWRVQEYLELYRAHSEAPPLVLVAFGKNRWWPLDGNQRLRAATLAGRKTHDAYVVAPCEQMILDRIAWSFNNHVHGERLSYEDSLQHAISFVRKYGMNCAAAAKEFGVKQRDVQDKLKVEEVKERARAQGVEPKHTLTEDVLTRLAPLQKAGDDVLAEAVRVVGESGATVRQAEDLVRDVGKADTHKAKVERVAAFASREEVAARRAATKNGENKVRTAAPRERLLRALKDAHAMSIYPKEAMVPFQKADRTEMLDLVEDVIATLTTLKTALEEAN